MKNLVVINVTILLKLAVLGLLCYSGVVHGQTPKIHSHNDYYQNVPFWKAYSAGANSIEVDIYLEKGKLLVGHDTDKLKNEHTLTALYLAPLEKMMLLNSAHKQLQLLIDVKSEAYTTLNALVKELKKYPSITKNKKIQLVVSGNRPQPTDYINYPDFILFDYQALDAPKNEQILSKIALVSLNFKKFSVWNGKGRLTAEDYKSVKATIDKAHSFNKPFRFWATPDSKSAWKALTDMGVDFINTDLPFECVTYLKSLARRVHQNPELVSVYKPKFDVDGNDQTPKNIILMIGDGNGLTQISAAALVNGGALTLTQIQNIGLLKTASGDDFTTDSAAAGTAIASGEKVPNRHIGVNANGDHLSSVMEILSKAGYTTAIITTDEITGATPSAFYAHQKDRDMTSEILADLGKSSLDYAISAQTKNAYDSNNVNNFKFLNDFTTITNSTEKLAAFFPKQTKPAPIAMAVEKLLPVLEKKEKPFFLMVEGAKIDSYGHENEIGNLVGESLAFDKAIGQALQFADASKNTLVIITADHETGGLTLPQGTIATKTIEAEFSSNDHTGVMVPIFAYGPKSHYFKGVFENNAVFTKMLQALDFPLKN